MLCIIVVELLLILLGLLLIFGTIVLVTIQFMLEVCVKIKEYLYF
jgi:hypothetical protein